MLKENPYKQNIAKLQLILAMIAFGTIGAFVKMIPLSSAEIALYRAVIAFAILFLYILLKKNFSNLTQIKGNLLPLFFSGIAMGFDWILLFEAYKYTSVALATLSYYFAPTVVILASAFLFKERLTKKQVFCFFASTIGLVLVVNVKGGGSNEFIGILYGLGAAIFYAMVVLINKATGKIDVIIRTWVQLAVSSLILLPYVMLTSGFHVIGIHSKGLFSLLFVGIVHTGIMYCLYFNSLSYLTGQQAAILSYIDPMVAVLVSIYWLEESITPMQLLGGAIILVFTMLNELRIKRGLFKLKIASS